MSMSIRIFLKKYSCGICPASKYYHSFVEKLILNNLMFNQILFIMRKQIFYPMLYLFLLLFFNCTTNEEKNTLGNDNGEIVTNHQSVLTKKEKQFISKTDIKTNDIITSFGFYNGESLKAMSFYETTTDTLKHSFWLIEEGDITNLSKFNQNAGPLIINSYNNLLVEELHLKGIEIDKIATYHNKEQVANKKLNRDNPNVSFPDDTYLNYIAYGYNNLKWKESSSSVNCMSSRVGCYYKPDFTCVVSGTGNPLDPNNPGYCYQHPYDNCMKSNYEKSPELKNGSVN